MVILNFLAAPRAARTGRARDLGEQENWGEAFQKTDTYANLALSIKRLTLNYVCFWFAFSYRRIFLACKNKYLAQHIYLKWKIQAAADNGVRTVGMRVLLSKKYLVLTS